MSSQQIVPGKSGADNQKASQSRFQRLWAEAEELAGDNAKLEKELDALVRRVGNEILTAELEMGKSIRDLVYRQLDFASKKSLLKWQRSELNEWIEDNLSELMMMDLIDEPLQNALALLRAAQLGVVIDPDSELSAAEQLDQYFGAYNDADDGDETIVRGESSSGGLFDDDDLDDTMKVEFDDESADEDTLEELLRKLRAEFEEFGEEEEAVVIKRSANPITDDVLKRLFRQTAAVLHPDKEPDEQRRLEKHGLMSQLLKARKERDLITIIKLHEAHSIADSTLSLEDEQALEEVLTEYLNQQQERMDDIIAQSPMHRMAYSEFYSEKPATVTRKVNAHLKKIEIRRQSNKAFVAEVKTLKRLKEILATRYDAQVSRPDWF